MTTLLALYALALQESPDSEIVEPAWLKIQAAAKLLEARDDGSSQLWRSSDRSKLQVKVEKDGHYWLNAGHVVKAIVHKNGQIVMLSASLSFAQHKPIPVEFRSGITGDEATVVAREIYALLDDRTTLQIRRIVDSGDSWHITGFPRTQPWPLGEGYECVFHIFKHRGLLEVAYLNYAPDLSATNVQVRTEIELRASAIDAYQRWKPFERAEVKGVKTVLLRPHYGVPNETTEEHFALAKANKVIPTFDMMIADADTVDPETGKFSRFQVIHVDARTGYALAIEPNELLGMSYSNLTPSEPDLKSASSLVVNGMSLDQIVLAKPKGRAPRPEWSESSSVLLQGKSAWKCHPSRDGRFVRVGESVYTVGRQTSLALKKLLAKRSKPFAGG